MNTKIMCVLFLSFLQLVPQVAAAETIELSSEELKAIARSVREVEDSLENVRIDSESWVEYGPTSSGPWQRSRVYIKSTAFFGPISSKQARVDVHSRVRPWINGAAEYLDESSSVSFNGLEGREIIISNSFDGETFVVNRAQILPEEPIEIAALRKATGIEATLFFHYRSVPEPFPNRFSAVFEAIADPDSFMETLISKDPNYSNIKPNDVTVALEELEGRQILKLISKGGGLTSERWFDPNRGFALLRDNMVREGPNGESELISSINVTRLEKAAKDIWWPMEVYFIRSAGKPGPANKEKLPWRRTVYRASEVVANDPDFDESIFTLSFPEGTKFQEYTTIYTAGENEK